MSWATPYWGRAQPPMSPVHVEGATVPLPPRTPRVVVQETALNSDAVQVVGSEPTRSRLTIVNAGYGPVWICAAEGDAKARNGWRLEPDDEWWSAATAAVWVGRDSRYLPYAYQSGTTMVSPWVRVRVTAEYDT